MSIADEKLKFLPESVWHVSSIGEVITNLKTNISLGLSEKEATNRLSSVGKNELPRGKRLYWWQIMLRQFQSPLIYILLIAAASTAWLGEFIDTSVILLVVLVNTLIGFYQEYQSSRTLEHLKKIVRITALVIRNGQTRIIDSEKLVPGDIIILKTGGKIPADARLIEAHEMKTGEALLTGESSPASKSLGVVTPEASLGDRHNMVWMGTTIERGSGRAVVVSTGQHTEIGKIAFLTNTATEELTPLQERLQRLARVITFFVVVAAVVILVIGISGRLDFVEAFKTAVAVAVAAIPEGLVAALSVVLAVSTKRILKGKGLVRRPVAAETLGSTTVICTDKTGTLTEGVMKIQQTFIEGNEATALLILTLANEAVIENKEGQQIIYGESTDKAKLEYSLGRDSSLLTAKEHYQEQAFLPFDSSTKYMASFVKRDQKTKAIHCLVSGAPEVLLERSVFRGENNPLDEKGRKQILALQEKLASSGYRLIGLADKILDTEISADNQSALHKQIYNLTFRGFVALRDPIRSDVKKTLRETRQAGIKVIMVTGDHKLTASAIGRELGFCTETGAVVDGQYLDSLTDEELREKINYIDICCRVNPSHKLRIVKALLKNGEAVAMTGDGINDAPALRVADIGIATVSATDVSKEVADLVLLDDGLSTISAAIKQGRIAFDNIKKVSIFLLSGSFTVLILILTSLLLGVPLPLTAVMILWTNLIENGLPTFALAFEPGEKDIMRRPPVPREAPILDSEGKVIVFGISLMRDFLLVGLFLGFYYYSSYSIEHIRTLVFAFISTDSLLYIFSIKSFRQPLWHENFFNNKYLLMAIGVSLILVLVALYMPFFNYFLGTVPLPFLDMILVVGIALLDIVLIETVKLFYRYRQSELVSSPVGL